MRIVYLSSAEIPSRKANAVHIMKMCAAFAGNGHSVTLVVPRSEDPLWSEDGGVFRFYGVEKSFTIVRLRRSPSRLGDYLFAIRSLMVTRKLAPDMVYSRFFLGSLVAAVYGIPGGLELHQLLPESSRIQKRLFRLLLGRPAFKRLVVITRPLKELFLQRFGVRGDLILVAPDGADLPPESGDPVPEGGRLRVGYVGHLYRGRGIDLILRMARECPWADFHMVGGTEEDIDRVRDDASDIENVTIHGFLPPAEAERIRVTMDILLAPYQKVVGLGSGELTTEAWMSPLKVFEYMAAGRAIVSSDLPILREVLEHGRNAVLCSPDSLPEWRTALEELRDDEPLRRRLGEAALEDVRTKYLWRIRAERIVDSIVSGPGT
jgi:glycosyltransferase involved in cell wall biosynthesis